MKRLKIMYFHWPQAGTTRHIFENTNNNHIIVQSIKRETKVKHYATSTHLVNHKEISIQSLIVFRIFPYYCFTSSITNSNLTLPSQTKYPKQLLLYIQSTFKYQSNDFNQQHLLRIDQFIKSLISQHLNQLYKFGLYHRIPGKISLQQPAHFKALPLVFKFSIFHRPKVQKSKIENRFQHP